MQIRARKTRTLKESEPLLPFLDTYIKHLPEEAIVVVTSKIVALAEGRVVHDATEEKKATIIKKESDLAIKTTYVWLTQKDGMILANAGVDESNARGHIILLPKNSFKAAAMIRDYLLAKHKRKHLGVLITDSRCIPLRAGVTGVALGYAGFKGLKDYRGKKDLFGRKLKFTQVNVADSLATAAVLTMGEGNERCPLAVITDAPVSWTQKVNTHELRIDPRDDMYRPLFDHLPKQ